MYDQMSGSTTGFKAQAHLLRAQRASVERNSRQVGEGAAGLRDQVSVSQRGSQAGRQQAWRLHGAAGDRCAVGVGDVGLQAVRILRGSHTTI